MSVNLCGPWTIEAAVQEFKRNKDGQKNSKTKEIVEKTVRAQIWALTMVHEALTWIEIVNIENKTSKNIALLVDAEWFCRYPRPLKCIHDNRTEFTGEEFQELLRSYGVKAAPTTVKNPQANAIHERCHLPIAETLRTQNLIITSTTTVKDEVWRLL